MHNGRHLAVLSAAVALIAGTSAHSASLGFGDATQYSVTMKSFDFCTDSTCSAATVANVSSTTKVIDIASVTAGADAASYANVAVPPLVLGRTYTHIRFRMSAVFTIKGSGTDNGGNFCNTTSANNNTSTTTAKAGAQAVSAAAAAAAATAQQMTVPLVGTFTAPTAADLAKQGMTQDGNDLVIVQSVPAFTATATAPTMVVKFDTQNTIVFVQFGPFSPCAEVFPMAPTVSMASR